MSTNLAERLLTKSRSSSVNLASDSKSYQDYKYTQDDGSSAA